MNPAPVIAPARAGHDSPAAPHPTRFAGFKPWLISVGALTAAFGVPLVALARYSLQHDLHSHALLIPVVSAYLIWNDRQTLPPFSAPRHAIAFGLAVLAVALLLGTWSISEPTTRLAAQVAAYVAAVAAAAAFLLGRATLRALAFPLAFLLFMIPLPPAAVALIETGLQHGSAAAADGMFSLSSTPVFRQELVFHLPGIVLQVAPECSGIRSTLALFITSVVAGKLFLRSPWLRLLLTVAVLPLALVRNGFRVFTLGELCARVSPAMIDSFIHHHGGPIFFALSLVPFSLLLFGLVRFDRHPRPPSP